MTIGTSHITSIIVKKPASEVFTFMADPAKLSKWSIGTWSTELLPDGLVLGTSLFDGSKGYVRIDPQPQRHSIDYHLGATPDALVPRIEVRVVPGPHLGVEDRISVLTFVAWRTATMDDDRWRRLTAAHELEVVLIKNLLESGRG